MGQEDRINSVQSRVRSTPDTRRIRCTSENFRGVPLTEVCSILRHAHTRLDASRVDRPLHYAGLLSFGKQLGEPRLRGT